MKTFEEYYADVCYKQDCEDNAMVKRMYDRNLTREERREKSKRKTVFITFICFIIFVLLIFLSGFLNIQKESEEENEEVNKKTSLFIQESQEEVKILGQHLNGDDIPATKRCYLTEEEVEQAENEMIEAALLARSERIDNVTVTHYCICEKCCGKSPDDSGYGITASGRYATPGVSVAVDANIIPLGSTVMADFGDGELVYFRADDTGSSIKGNKIDICMDSHEAALNAGVKTATIWWCEE